MDREERRGEGSSIQLQTRDNRVAGRTPSKEERNEAISVHEEIWRDRDDTMMGTE